MKQGNVASAPLRGRWLGTPTRMLSNSRASMRTYQGTPGLGLAANGHLRPRAPPASNLPAWLRKLSYGTMRSGPGRKARLGVGAKCRHESARLRVG
jgi:hypothetical protein